MFIRIKALYSHYTIFEQISAVLISPAKTFCYGCETQFSTSRGLPSQLFLYCQLRKLPANKSMLSKSCLKSKTKLLGQFADYANLGQFAELCYFAISIILKNGPARGSQ